MKKMQDYRITGKMPRARLTCARPPRCVTDVEVVENADHGYGVATAQEICILPLRLLKQTFFLDVHMSQWSILLLISLPSLPRPQSSRSMIFSMSGSFGTPYSFSALV